MSKFNEIKTILLGRTSLPNLLAPPPADRSKPVTSAPWKDDLQAQISALPNAEAVPLFAAAALHLFNDDIGSCHEMVEKHDGHAIADYLHYILHRREGDYWNAE
jgi:lysophospholipase L1-like esterase